MRINTGIGIILFLQVQSSFTANRTAHRLPKVTILVTSIEPGEKAFCGHRPFDDRNGEYADKDSTSDNPDDSPGMDKIVGGTYAASGEIPWQVNIKRYVPRLNKFKPICGGAIVNAFWILTAAHCVHDENVTTMQIVVGDHHLMRTDKGEQLFQVEKVILHPRYHDDNFYDDIALVKIKRLKGHGIVFNDQVQPVCLPIATKMPRPGTQLLFSGWGRVTELPSQKSLPRLLKKTQLPLKSGRECQRLYRGMYKRTLFCAGYVQGDTGPALGDSGGPVVHKNGSAYYLLGINVSGKRNELSTYPTLFSRIASYLHWILQTIQRNRKVMGEDTIPRRPQLII